MNKWYYTKHDMIGDAYLDDMDNEDLYTSGYEYRSSENWISRLIVRILGL